MRHYKCLICGHVYNLTRELPLYGYPPGTVFDDLPDDWQCPVCSAPKHLYEKQ